MADLRAELYRVYETKGALTPKLVVDAARPKRSPLHSHFEWDDRIAGPKYREHQARELIRSVRVVYVTPGQTEASVREFHAVRSTEGTHTYRPVDEIVEDPIAVRLLLKDMERDWRALLARYQRFDEFRQIVSRDLGAAS